MMCNHKLSIAPIKDNCGVTIGTWCYKCQKVWFDISKGQNPLKIKYGGRDE